MDLEDFKQIEEREIDRLRKEVDNLNKDVERLKGWNKWFFGRVRFMRECQKDYFKARKNMMPKEYCDGLKRKSMAVESEIDKEIERVDGLNQYKMNFE